MPNRPALLIPCIAFTSLLVACDGGGSDPGTESTTSQSDTAEQTAVVSELSEAPEPGGSSTMETTETPEETSIQTASTAQAPGSGPETTTGDKPYSIVDGKVDEDTYTGWQTFRVVGCGQCHGGTGEGGVANLVDRLKVISKEQFVKSVMDGKNQMPPWKGNPRVVDNIDRIYAYLKARSDGALGKEKPQK